MRPFSASEQCPLTEIRGLAPARKLLAGTAGITAIVTANDLLALAVRPMQCARSACAARAIFRWATTTYRWSTSFRRRSPRSASSIAKWVAARALLLLKEIDNRHATVQHVILQPELIVRESTTPTRERIAAIG